jgi:hypothetical protein
VREVRRIAWKGGGWEGGQERKERGIRKLKSFGLELLLMVIGGLRLVL